MNRFLMCIVFVLALSAQALAGDPFVVAGLPVDATGDDVIQAQIEAQSEGQTQAANILMARLTLPEDRRKAGFTGFETEEAAKMIRGLEIANEKRSSDRYIADITVTFDPRAVQSALSQRGIPVITAQANQRLVLPVLANTPLWSANPWTSAWAQPSLNYTLTPIMLASPSSANATLIDADNARRGDKSAIQSIARAHGVDHVLVAVASPSSGGYSINLTEYDLEGRSSDLGRVSANSLNGGAYSALQKIEDDWKRKSISRVKSARDVQVSVLYNSHREWIIISDELTQSSLIVDAQLDALSKDGAMMTLTVASDLAGLSEELSYKGLSLREDRNLGLVIQRRGR